MSMTSCCTLHRRYHRLSDCMMKCSLLPILVFAIFIRSMLLRWGDLQLCSTAQTH
jgi:hypothetical protein